VGPAQRDKAIRRQANQRGRLQDEPQRSLLAWERVFDDSGERQPYVPKIQTDVNGAVTIADRYLSGESRSREHENDDDSAEGGARLTAPQDSQADADTQQLTLGTYAS
jgi:hypothetical protein